MLFSILYRFKKNEYSEKLSKFPDVLQLLGKKRETEQSRVSASLTPAYWLFW